MNIFYVPNAETDEIVLMDGQEWRHCNKSLRNRMGDVVTLVNGRGGKFKAQIIEESAGNGKLKVIHQVNEDKLLNVNMHIAIAPTKQIARIEWAVEKMTEMGLHEITFLETKFSERSKMNMARLEKICISAMKQSLQASKPIIRPVLPFEKFLKEYETDGRDKFIAYVEEREITFAKNYRKGNNVIVLIGPEGGFSKKEASMAQKYGFIPVSLGYNRLRTETACIAVCQTFHTLNML